MALILVALLLVCTVEWDKSFLAAGKDVTKFNFIYLNSLRYDMFTLYWELQF